MINYVLDVPFSIGDRVLVRNPKLVHTKIQCPFCKGSPLYDVGMKRIRITMTERYEEPWVITCRTCSGTGEIRELTGFEYEEQVGTLTGVYQIHNWMPDTVYTIVLDDGTEQRVSGKCISMLEEES